VALWTSSNTHFYFFISALLIQFWIIFQFFKWTASGKPTKLFFCRALDCSNASAYKPKKRVFLRNKNNEVDTTDTTNVWMLHPWQSYTILRFKFFIHGYKNINNSSAVLAGCYRLRFFGIRFYLWLWWVLMNVRHNLRTLCQH
jgi:hypothetical protein